MLFFPLEIWDAESRIILGNVSRPFGLSLSVLGRFSLLSTDLGPSIKWAGVVRFLGPTTIIIIFVCVLISITVYSKKKKKSDYYSNFTSWI